MRPTFQDRLLLLGTRFFTAPFFRDSLETARFDAHLQSIRLEVGSFDGPRFYPIQARTLAGPLDIGFRILHWGGEGAPCVVHHQGGGEQPFDRIIRGAYPSSDTVQWTVIAAKAALQENLKQQNSAFAHLHNYVAMIAASVMLTETLFRSYWLSPSKVKVVSGYSLGGFVTMRHHLCFDSADIYIPFVAGGRHTDIFLDTVHSGIATIEDAQYVRERLDMETEWSRRDHPNVYPVLARRDGLNRLETMLPSFGSTPVEFWEKGHLQGASSPALVRAKIDRHILEKIQESA